MKSKNEDIVIKYEVEKRKRNEVEMVGVSLR